METKQHLPVSNDQWLLYGAGFDNLGRDGRFEALPLRRIQQDEVLLKVMAVSLCFSDVKVVWQGSAHPRLTGRDLAHEPLVLSHEVTVQVVCAGDEYKAEYKPGARYVIQPDIYYGGKPFTMGYVLGGALQQYIIAGDAILKGDEGCYLLPIPEDVGYSEAALCEPWSCVEASYNIPYRTAVRHGGTALIIGSRDMYGENYELGSLITAKHHPRRIIVSNMGRDLLKDLKEAARAFDIDLIEEDFVRKWPDISLKYTNSNGFDDIIMIGTPEARELEAVSALLARGGVFAIAAKTPMEQKTNIDVGALHYDGIRFTGTAGNDLSAAYKLKPIEIPEDGAVWMAGAGGPLGQMHVQRACERPCGPSKILATDIDAVRLSMVQQRFEPLAQNRGAQLRCVDTQAIAPKDWEQHVARMSSDGMFDYIVLLAPVASLVAEAFERLAPDGVISLFAGIPKGTKVQVDVSNCYLHHQTWIGSSGTLIAHMKAVLHKIEKKTLRTNRTVAAVGGMGAAKQGLMAVAEGAKPGKVVIYPHVDLPLTDLPDLRNVAPEVYAKLEDGRFWTAEAERVLLNQAEQEGIKYAK